MKKRQKPRATKTTLLSTSAARTKLGRTQPGSPKTRRIVKQIASRVLSDTADETAENGAERLGLVFHDIKNLRAGNLPSLQLLVRLVAKGRYSPSDLIAHGKLRKLPGRASTRAVQQRLISSRIRALAKAGDPATLAKKSGLSIFHIYQLRVRDKSAGLHTVLGFINAGTPIDDLFFGRKR